LATGWFDMSETKRRAPVAINLNAAPEAPKPMDEAPRLPRAMSPAKVKISDENFGEVSTVVLEPETPTKRFPLGTIFVSAASALITLWLSSSLYIWVENLIATKPQLGWLAACLAALTALALVGFIAREIFAITRLSGNQTLRKSLETAKLENNIILARSAVSSLVKITETLPATAKGRTNFSETDREFLSAIDLINLAENDLVKPLDIIAIERVTASAKRVSVVTAISPRAFVDIAYVLYENAKLIRAVAEIYGCRPGVFGFLRLARETLAHLAVTGAVAMGDSIVQQIVGHGMAARVSAKLGEGVLNGLMTARIGFAAMDVTRPAPFSDANRPKITQVLSVLNPMSGKQSE
jgi:putative membrane protein